MAYIKGWMTSEDGKTVFAVCEHHKVGVPTLAEHNELRIPWDEQFLGSKSTGKLDDAGWEIQERERDQRRRLQLEQEAELQAEWEKIVKSKI